jgi:O-antigen/teichoic acid export membrane protein
VAPNRTLRYLSAMTLIFGVSGVIGVGRMLGYAAILGPTSFGLFTFAQILITAGIYLSTLGFNEGLIREIPMLLGQGLRAQADKALSLGLGWSLAGGAVIAALFFAAVHVVPMLSRYLPIALAGLAMLSIVACNLVGTGIRGRSLNIEAGYVVLARTTAATVLGLGAAIHFGVTGALVGEAIGSAIVAAIGLHRFIPGTRPKVELDPEASRVLKIGSPFLISNVVLNLSQSIDSWFVQGKFGPTLFGQYSFAMILFSVGLNLAAIVTQYVQPRALTEFGRTGDHRRLFAHLRQVAIYVGLLFVAGALPFFLLVPWGIHHLYPKYTQAIALLPFVYAGTGIMSMIGLFETYIIAERRGPLMASLYGVTLTLVAAGCAVLTMTHAELWQFAAIFCAGRMINLAGVYFLGKYSLSSATREQTVT